MKKYLAICLALPLLFASCVFVQQEDYGKMAAKTTYKSFDTVNEPIIVNIPFQLNFNLYGNKNFTESRKYLGGVFVIYDWENNKVIDYVTAPGHLIYPREALCGVKKAAGGTKFYAIDNSSHKFWVMDSSASELKCTSLSDDTFNLDMGNILLDEGTSIPVSITSNYDKEINKYHHYNGILNTLTDELPTSSKDLTEVFSNDRAKIEVVGQPGKYWFLTTNHAPEDHYRDYYDIYIYDNATDEGTLVKTFKAEDGAYDTYEGFEISDDYSLFYADEDYLYLCKRRCDGFKGNKKYSFSVVTVDINDNYQTSECTFENVPEECQYIRICTYDDDKVYFILETFQDNSFYLMSYDISSKTTQTTAPKILSLGSIYNYNVVPRNNQLYFISANNGVASIAKYNPSTDSLNVIKAINFNSLLEMNE